MEREKLTKTDKAEIEKIKSYGIPLVSVVKCKIQMTFTMSSEAGFKETLIGLVEPALYGYVSYDSIINIMDCVIEIKDTYRQQEGMDIFLAKITTLCKYLSEIEQRIKKYHGE